MIASSLEPHQNLVSEQPTLVLDSYINLSPTSHLHHPICLSRISPLPSLNPQDLVSKQPTLVLEHTGRLKQVREMS